MTYHYQPSTQAQQQAAQDTQDRAIDTAVNAQFEKGHTTMTQATTSTKPRLIIEGYRATLIALYKRTGGHFFDADSMRFFNSRISERVYQVGGHNEKNPAQYVFVTSERNDGAWGEASNPRLYTVRHWDGTSTNIDSVPDFQAFETREAAHKAAKQYAQELARK